MNFLGVPFAVRQSPKQARDILSCPIRCLSHVPSRPLVPIYFSCERDFELLRLSLRSLSFIEPGVHVERVVVVVAKPPFSASQRSALHEAQPGLELIDGADEVHDLSAVTILPGSLIAKVDSDILFFSLSKIRQVVRWPAHFIGDEHWSGEDYSQGGLYFASSDLLSSLDQQVSDGEIECVIGRLGCSAEARVISALVDLHRAQVWNTDLMLFPDEFGRANLGNPFVRREYCALHFFEC